MIKVKEVRKEIRNGKNRGIALWKCTSCGLEKEGRSDMKQTTTLCNSCKKTTHGKEGTKLYSVWLNMKSRCYNPQNKRYSSYGARGIVVCQEWHIAKVFMEWAENNGFKEVLGKRNTEYTLDRINNDGNYEPSNCRIVSMETQYNNRQALMKNNKSGYRGVSKKETRWVTSVTIKGKVVFRASCKTAYAAALKREQYIIENKLPHVLNNIFSKKVSSGLNWSEMETLNNDASIEEINEVLEKINGKQ